MDSDKTCQSILKKNLLKNLYTYVSIILIFFTFLIDYLTYTYLNLLKNLYTYVSISQIIN
mgnify:CR=1 FL=1